MQAQAAAEEHISAGSAGDEEPAEPLLVDPNVTLLDATGDSSP